MHVHPMRKEPVPLHPMRNSGETGACNLSYGHADHAHAAYAHMHPMRMHPLNMHPLNMHPMRTAYDVQGAP